MRTDHSPSDRWRRWLAAVLLSACVAGFLAWREYQRRVRVDNLVWEVGLYGGEVYLAPTPLDQLQKWRSGTPVTWRSGAMVALYDGTHLDTAWLQDHNYLEDLSIAFLVVDDEAVSEQDALILIDRHPLEVFYGFAQPNADEVAAALAKKSQLHSVNLTDSELTDAGFRKLPLERLVMLDVDNTDVTASALGELHRCQKLQFVSIDGEQLDESVVATLAALPSLECVTLKGAAVDDKNLQLIAALPNLPHLELFDTDVSDSASTALKQAMPDTFIQRLGPE